MLGGVGSIRDESLGWEGEGKGRRESVSVDNDTPRTLRPHYTILKLNHAKTTPLTCPSANNEVEGTLHRKNGLSIESCPRVRS